MSKGKRHAPNAARIARVTWPIIYGELRQHLGRIFLLIVLSAFVGLLPAMKSAIESAVFSHVDELSRRPAVAAASVREVIASPLSPRLDNRDWLERGTGGALAGKPLGTAVLAYLFLTVCGASVLVTSTRIRATLSKRSLAVLRGTAIRMAMTTDAPDLPKGTDVNVAGRFATAIHEGAGAVAETYDFFFSAGEEIFAIVATLIVLIAKGPWFAAIFLAFIVLVALVSLLQQRRLHDKRKLFDAQRNNLVAQTDEILSKREILVAYEQQERYSKKVDVITDDYAGIERDLTVAEQRYEQIRSSVIDVGRMAVFVVAAIAAIVVTRHDGVSTGFDAYFIVTLYARLLSPVSNLMQRYDSMKRSEGTAATFLAVLDHEPAVPVPQERPVMSPTSPAIEFKDVNFSYDDERPILRDFSIEVPLNKVTLILGPSGCGKSTIARIILGFWRASGVQVGGRPISAYSPAELRLLMSYVAQGDHIVEDTVSENLDWARTTAITDEEKIVILVDVGLAANRQEASIVLGRAAKSLSLGQQQRLSVARMMLDDSPIFILDEPLSGVDIFTFSKLLPNLSIAFRRPNRTVLMTSHRLAFASHVDQVIILDENGSVMEMGDPHLLRASADSLFSHLLGAAIAELE
jgi:ABC-type multidrug transport system fused ATPase/permease subunit